MTHDPHDANRNEPPDAVESERDPSTVPFAAQVALRKAMALEGIPGAHFHNLLWIMAQESGGNFDARNPRSTARGLFQLTRGSYGFNPNGAQSFGNAVQECQGGIRYIQSRYHSTQSAKHFWKQHHWY